MKDEEKPYIPIYTKEKIELEKLKNNDLTKFDIFIKSLCEKRNTMLDFEISNAIQSVLSKYGIQTDQQSIIEIAQTILILKDHGIDTPRKVHEFIYKANVLADKDTPKKPTIIPNDKGDNLLIIECPNCGKRTYTNFLRNYCGDCGQRLSQNENVSLKCGDLVTFKSYLNNKSILRYIKQAASDGADSMYDQVSSEHKNTATYGFFDDQHIVMATYHDWCCLALANQLGNRIGWINQCYLKKVSGSENDD